MNKRLVYYSFIHFIVPLSKQNQPYGLKIVQILSRTPDGVQAKVHFCKELQMAARYVEGL